MFVKLIWNMPKGMWLCLKAMAVHVVTLSGNSLLFQLLLILDDLIFNGSPLKHMKHVHLYKWHAYFFEKDKNFGYKYNEVGFCFVVQ